MKQKTLHYTAATVFGLAGLLHLVRLVLQLPLVIGTWNVPYWLSAIAVLVTGYLAVTLVQTAKK